MANREHEHLPDETPVAAYSYEHVHGQVMLPCKQAVRVLCRTA